MIRDVDLSSGANFISDKSCCEKSDNIYIHESMKIIDPYNTFVEQPSEGDIKVLIVPEHGNQKLIIFRLHKDTNCTVNDILSQLNQEFHNQIVEIYSVTDYVYNVRFVITVRPKLSGDDTVEQNQYFAESNKNNVDNSLITDSSCISNSTKHNAPMTPYLKRKSNIKELKLSKQTNGVKFRFKSRTHIITTYPLPPYKGAITITVEDFNCLDENRYLNDTIIDFYLKYLTLEQLPEKNRQRIYVFNSYFYTRLTRLRRTSIKSDDMPMATAEHDEIRRWTRNVNIFEKDFIFLPIHQNNHWFLSVICYPGLIGKDTDKNNAKVPERVQYPCILIFDSLSHMNEIGTSVVKNIKKYLLYEYRSQTDVQKNGFPNDIAIHYPDIPKQFNSTDCGLYLLQYAESFLKDFVISGTLYFPMKPINNWFNSITISKKRTALKKLLVRIATESKGIRRRRIL